MNANVYVCKNLLSKMCDSVHIFTNDEMASVYLAVFCAKKAPLDEFQIIRVAEISLDTCEITPCSHYVVAFDDRRIRSEVLDGYHV